MPAAKLATMEKTGTSGYSRVLSQSDRQHNMPGNIAPIRARRSQRTWRLDVEALGKRVTI
jgi:hypothetical protein